MKKLINQIMKFGVVGGLAFLIDYGVFVLLANKLEINYLIANIFSFTLSLIFNYLMSMKFVFERKENTDKRKEFVTFTILSVIGLGIQELIILGCVDGIYLNNAFLQEKFDIDLAKQAGKIIATGVVMVYNFISRKIFIEGISKGDRK
ncbi:MAG: GtrA family protein [Lachnospiraceae bacterium]|nr:GtrA family protein [Lachnospiraceae bacterium]